MLEKYWMARSTQLSTTHVRSLDRAVIRLRGNQARAGAFLSLCRRTQAGKRNHPTLGSRHGSDARYGATRAMPMISRFFAWWRNVEGPQPRLKIVHFPYTLPHCQLSARLHSASSGNGCTVSDVGFR